eukprot:scaffold4010_cov98-Phaeocystis_antarctica.AAC.7
MPTGTVIAPARSEMPPATTVTCLVNPLRARPNCKSSTQVGNLCDSRAAQSTRIALTIGPKAARWRTWLGLGYRMTCWQHGSMAMQSCPMAAIIIENAPQLAPTSTNTPPEPLRASHEKPITAAMPSSARSYLSVFLRRQCLLRTNVLKLCAPSNLRLPRSVSRNAVQLATYWRNVAPRTANSFFGSA